MMTLFNLGKRGYDRTTETDSRFNPGDRPKPCAMAGLLLT